MAYEIPGLRFSAVSGEEIKRYHFVSINKDEEGVMATAETPVAGVAMNDPSADQVLEIARGIVMVQSSEKIAAGDYVTVGEGGTAAVGTNENKVGIAITGTELTNGHVSVLID